MPDKPEQLFDWRTEVISRYTRAQAIEDGVLIDLTARFPDLVSEAGFKILVACTAAVFYRYCEMTKAAERMGADIKGRTWDAPWMLNRAIAHAKRTRASDSTLFYAVIKSF